jgi:chemotaxis protein histidine kinase CheA
MSPEQSRSPIDALQAQLRQTLDGHLASLTQQYEQAIADARRAASEEAEQAIATRLEAVEVEWASRLESELASARADAQRQLVAEVTRVRAEAEQQTAESAARMRQELEAALATERQRAESLVQAERSRAEQELETARHDAREAADRLEEATRARAQAEAQVRTQAEAHSAAQAQLARDAGETADRLEQVTRAQAQAEEQARTHAEAHSAAQAQLARQGREAAERLEQATRARTQAEEQARTHAEAHSAAQAQLARHAEELKRQPKATGGTGVNVIEGLRAIDASRTLTEALGTVLRHTSSIAPRAAVFVINGARLKSWKTVGFPQFEAQPFESAISGSGLLAQAIQTGEAVVSGPSQPPPTFASLPGDLSALVVPVLVGGRAVALLYADNGGNSDIAGVWRDAVESLVRHASTHLALLTAMRTVQAIGAGAPVGTGGAVAPEGDSHDQSARRYARLLVSEIKLYNEAAVHAGRQQRDLLRRLQPEIDRARRLYEERISAAVGARGAYFQQELVQTLADGDPALLGNS